MLAETAASNQFDSLREEHAAIENMLKLVRRDAKVFKWSLFGEGKALNFTQKE